MSKEEILRENLYFIGFGFSYQAIDTKTNSLVCDWTFKSGTLNTSGLFGSDPSLKTVAHRSDRQLEQKLSAFLRISFNYMRATKTRKVQVRSIRNLWIILKQTLLRGYLPALFLRLVEIKLGIYLVLSNKLSK